MFVSWVQQLPTLAPYTVHASGAFKMKMEKTTTDRAGQPQTNSPQTPRATSFVTTAQIPPLSCPVWRQQENRGASTQSDEDSVYWCLLSVSCM